MVIYDICCASGHSFEAWFSDPADCRHQLDSKLIRCPVCDEVDVRKMPTASKLQKLQPRMETPYPFPEIDKVRAYVDAHFEDVGTEFPEEARRIHYGETGQRNIRGTVSPQEVVELVDEGIPVTPLPPQLSKLRDLN